MSKLTSPWEAGRNDIRRITEVSEYRAEPAIAIIATQLGMAYTRTQAARVVAEWVEFLSGGPSAIAELRFLSRTPKRLFDALAAQTQVERLFLKWGDYDDLGPLRRMTRLRALRLGGASCIQDVSPLAELTQLRHLEIDSIRRAHDLSRLGALTELRQLEIGGDWQSLRNGHIDSIAWIAQLENLEQLLIHTLIVDDHDYTPLLRLPHLNAVRVMASRGMHPTIEELQGSLRWAN